MNNDALQRISYALSKQVPDMARGFTIHTSYGDIEIDAADADSVIVAVQCLLIAKHQEASHV